MSEEKPETGGTAGEPRKQSMLYEVCPHCGGKGGNIGRPGINMPCCKMLGVVETGATAGQLNYLVDLDKLRQEAGISAAMLRDGRAKKIVEEHKEAADDDPTYPIQAELVSACKLALDAYDQALIHGKSALTGESVDNMRAAVARAEGKPAPPPKDWRIGLSCKPRLRTHPDYYEPPGKIVEVFTSGYAGIWDGAAVLRIERNGKTFLALADDWITA